MPDNTIQQAGKGSLQAVRAAKIITLAGETAARGLEALSAPAQELKDAVIVGRDGKILAVESYRDFKRRVAVESCHVEDLGPVTLLPGFVNAHCHLELSDLPGRTVGGRGFSVWVKSLMAQLGGGGVAEHSRPNGLCGLATAVEQLTDSFTVAVGDVVSRDTGRVAAALLKHGVSAHFFVECFGYGTQSIPSLWEELPLKWKQSGGADEILAVEGEHFSDHGSAHAAGAHSSRRGRYLASLAGHALYSTSLSNLQSAKTWCREHGRTFSLHLAEHPDELEFVRTGRGQLADFLAVRVLPPDFAVSGQVLGLSPVLAADAAGLLDSRTLAVHCVHCGPEELEVMGQRGVFAALCPRSNAYIGVGEAQVKKLAASGACLCLGTDSLASNHDLNFLSEIFALKNLALSQGFELGLPALARICALNGAAALGLDSSFGRLESGHSFCYSVFPEERKVSKPTMD